MAAVTAATVAGALTLRKRQRFGGGITFQSRQKLISKAQATLLGVRRRWGLALVRFVVGLVVRVELMAAQTPAEATALLADAMEATKRGITDFTGKDEYKFGDVTKAAFSRVRDGIADFTGKEEYEFGDVTKAVVSNFTGKQEYEFGDIAKAAAKKVTGKDEYRFGDITKSLASKLSGVVEGAMESVVGKSQEEKRKDTSLGTLQEEKTKDSSKE